MQSLTFKKTIPLLILTLMLLFHHSYANASPLSPEYLESLDQELVNAAKEGQLDLIQSLMKKGADINCRASSLSKPNETYGNQFVQPERKCVHTALMLASANGHIEVVEFLIEKGARINLISLNYCDEDTPYPGWTALNFARFYGHPEIVELLKNLGAIRFDFLCFEHFSL